MDAELRASIEAAVGELGNVVRRDTDRLVAAVEAATRPPTVQLVSQPLTADGAGIIAKKFVYEAPEGLVAYVRRVAVFDNDFPSAPTDTLYLWRNEVTPAGYVGRFQSSDTPATLGGRGAPIVRHGDRLYVTGQDWPLNTTGAINLQVELQEIR